MIFTFSFEKTYESAAIANTINVDLLLYHVDAESSPIYSLDTPLTTFIISVYGASPVVVQRPVNNDIKNIIKNNFTFEIFTISVLNTFIFSFSITKDAIYGRYITKYTGYTEEWKFANKIPIIIKIIPYFFMRNHYRTLKNTDFKYSFTFPFVKKSMTNDTFFTIAIGRNILKNGITNYDNLTIHGKLKFPHSGVFDILITSIYNLFGFNLFISNGS